MDLFGGLLSGFHVVLQPVNFLYCFVGVFIGTLIGVLPGIGPISGTALLIPLTFHLNPTGAIIMLGAIYYGSQYGGTITTVLLGVPGEVSSTITMLDGHAMAKRGRAGVALSTAAVGSFIGGTFATLCLMVAARPLTKAALVLGPPEYFSMMALGLCLATGLAGKSLLKALIMTVFGILLSLVGQDPMLGTPRLTFGRAELVDGIELLSVAMGLFGISEILLSLEEPLLEIVTTRMKSLIPTRKDVSDSIGPVWRGTMIGTVLGVIPGLTAPVSSFISYALERRVSNHPEKFGKGMLQGIAGPETANNAHANAGMIPLLTLGIPSNGVMAIILGAFMINGLAPGPLLFQERPDMVWGIIASCYIGNVMLLVLNLPLIPMWVSVLRIPYSILCAFIMAFIMVGGYSANNNIFDVWLMCFFGILGYVCRKLDFPLTPVVLTFVLAPMMEKSLYRSLLMSQGSASIFITRPISLVLLLVAAGVLILFMARTRKQMEAFREESEV